MYRWTNIVWLFYTTNISVDLAHQEIFHAKVGKGGINEHEPYVMVQTTSTEPATGPNLK